MCLPAKLIRSMEIKLVDSTSIWELGMRISFLILKLVGIILPFPRLTKLPPVKPHNSYFVITLKIFKNQSVHMVAAAVGVGHHCCSCRLLMVTTVLLITIAATVGWPIFVIYLFFSLIYYYYCHHHSLKILLFLSLLLRFFYDLGWIFMALTIWMLCLDSNLLIITINLI